MLEDEWLKVRFKAGSAEALRRIYEKYRDRLLTLAMALLNDSHAAEDVVHDVFVSFARTAGGFSLTGTLKGYLSTCLANCARDRNRLKSRLDVGLEAAADVGADSDDPAEYAVGTEQAERLRDVLGRLPYEQREIIVLHLHQEMRFREIAKALGISINTVQSRYRYGMKKLRSIINSTVTI